MISRERLRSARALRPYWPIFARCYPRLLPALENLCASSASAFGLPRQGRKTLRWICCRGGCLLAKLFGVSAAATAVYICIAASETRHPPILPSGTRSFRRGTLTRRAPDGQVHQGCDQCYPGSSFGVGLRGGEDFFRQREIRVRGR